MTINNRDFLKSAAWWEKLGPEIRKGVPGQFRTIGDRLVRTARRKTQQEDAVVTGGYLRGWRYRLRVQSGRIPGVARGTAQVSMVFENTAPHAYYAEKGRRPGKFPPKEAIEAWMRRRGIPMEASFPIRRSIAELGTIRRKGAYGQPKGFEIMRQTMDEEETRIIRDLGEAYDRALLRWQSLRR